jgi:hypothetical protein
MWKLGLALAALVLLTGFVRLSDRLMSVQPPVVVGASLPYQVNVTDTLTTAGTPPYSVGVP